MSVPRATRPHIAASLDRATEKVSVRELLDGKGKVKRTQIFVQTAEEAAAAAAAGIDLVNIAYTDSAPVLAAAAGRAFTMFGLHWRNYASQEELMRGAFTAMMDGADSIYCAKPARLVEALAEEGVPVCPHVGLVPTKRTWTGGWRAVGKTADQALKLYKDVKRYEDAGAFAVEMEVVPERVASEIARRVKLLVISMGSGSGGDVQYLFASDLLGLSTPRVPRHAKIYRNFRAEYDRLQCERVKAFSEFSVDVTSGAFPQAGHTVQIEDEEFETFLEALG